MSQIRGSVLFFLPVFSLLFFACELNRPEELPREELFTLSIGKMENQIDFFQSGNASPKPALFLRDGAFFIADSASQKILELTSFGDLLRLFYDPEENPHPVSLQIATDGSPPGRSAHPFSFLQIGAIAVSSDKMLYVEDRLPPERSMFDETLGSVLNKIVLRFDSGGTFRGYLGQEGIGGTPFPYIQSLHTTNADDLVVLCRTPRGWIVFWFSAEGELVYRVNLPMEKLPVPENGSYLPSLESILPDPVEPKLYLKMNYYVEAVDAATGLRFGIENVISKVYWFNIETARYEGHVEIPANIRRRTTGTIFESEEVEYLYELLGIGPGGHLFLISREDDNRQQLLVLSRDGKVVRRRYIHIEDDKLVFSLLHLSPEGILAGMLADDRQVKIVWWRTDRLLSPGQ